MRIKARKFKRTFLQRNPLSVNELHLVMKQVRAEGNKILNRKRKTEYKNKEETGEKIIKGF